jgi:alkanesulfonate monooxygenase SsuD/methylene tetrahydromethanopterin reductase-like flavin-dependent oxidoreductase (luciferase family)
MIAWPKPVQKPHPPIIVGGAFPYQVASDGFRVVINRSW